MELFDVVVRPRIHMIVRAKNAAHARDLAIQGTFLRYPDTFGLEASAGVVGRHVRTDVERGLAKSESIECTHCGAIAHREEWGPGWVTCPACRRHPPTPAEVAAKTEQWADLLTRHCADCGQTLGTNDAGALSFDDKGILAKHLCVGCAGKKLTIPDRRLQISLAGPAVGAAGVTIPAQSTCSRCYTSYYPSDLPCPTCQPETP